MAAAGRFTVVLKRRFRLTAAIRAACALAAAGVGLGLAAHHPLSPAAALAGFAFVGALTLWRPGSWLAVLPAVVPLASLSPWTGWLVVDEFDICVCAVLAAGYAAGLRRNDAVGVERMPVAPAIALGAFGTLVAIGLLRGWLDAAPAGSLWWQGHLDPMNSWRVAKSLVWALLLLPLLADHVRCDPGRASRRLAIGMLAGLTAAVLGGLWERLAYPGLLDFSEPYRTVAMFWEMHVGGAAIDAYTALAAPFVGWALWRARTPLAWCAAAALAVLTAYAALTTFSRGVYLASTAPLLLVGAWLWRRQRAEMPALSLPRWHLGATALLVVMLALEVALVLGSGTFMHDRMKSTRHDFGSRLAHWHKGVALLDGPADWLLGTGLGRLPSRYAAATGLGELPGAIRLVDDDIAGRYLRLDGPRTLPELAGLFRLTQRILLGADGRYRIALQVRAARPVDLAVSVCESHLLYERQCQRAALTTGSHPTAWQTLAIELQGPSLDPGAWYAPRLGVLAVSVAQAGAGVDLRLPSLRAANGTELLRNRTFGAGMAHWFPSARYYFLPWHIDNLYLELLIERGLTGLLAFGALIAWALRSACSVRGEQAVFARFVAAALGGVLIVGLVSSVMDVPRVAFVVWLLAFFCILLGRNAGREATTIDQ